MQGHVVPKKTYFLVFITLIALTALTTAVAFKDLGPMNTVAALAIAVCKATLVILFFMHVVDANRLTKLFVAGTFIWLVVMFAFTFTDYVSRKWTQASRGWAENPTVVEEHHVYIKGDALGYQEHKGMTTAPAAKE